MQSRSHPLVEIAEVEAVGNMDLWQSCQRLVGAGYHAGTLDPSEGSLVCPMETLLFARSWLLRCLG